MIPLRVHLDTAGFVQGETVTVSHNGRDIARAKELVPGGVSFPDGIDITTAPIYFGLHTITATAFDKIGNPQVGGASEDSRFINTGPRPPKSPRFYSQDGAGPVSIVFHPSPELDR